MVRSRNSTHCAVGAVDAVDAVRMNRVSGSQRMIPEIADVFVCKQSFIHDHAFARDRRNTCFRQCQETIAHSVFFI